MTLKFRRRSATTVADATRRTLGPRHPFRLVKDTSENGGFVIRAECLVCGGSSVKCGGGSGKNPTLQNFVHHHVEKPMHQKKVQEKFGADENDPTAGTLKKPEPRIRKELVASSSAVSAGGTAQVSSSTATSQPMTIARSRTPQGFMLALRNLKQSDAPSLSWSHSATCQVKGGQCYYCCTRCPKKIPCNPGVEGAVKKHLSACKEVSGQTKLPFLSQARAPAESSSAFALNVAPTTDVCTVNGSSSSSAAEALSF
mmetsp:Transcript_27707/g.84993  ORF Transcript_27707/g.84993 Transcript_27707/m.84993 type:complete len:256 (+) Transcript_27707:172-939(+)